MKEEKKKADKRETEDSLLTLPGGHPESLKVQTAL